MSTNEHDHDTENVTPIRTPRQLITAIILAFVVPIITIALLTMYVGAGQKPGHGADALTPESIEARIRPVAGFELRDPNAPVVLRAGEEVFKGQCAACHTAGVAGAPKVGDTAGWAPRLAKGFDTLWQHALKGLGAMPPQAGGEYNDLEIGRAVVYMTNASGGKFAEPKAPAQQAGGSTPTTDAQAATQGAAGATPPTAPVGAPQGGATAAGAGTPAAAAAPAASTAAAVAAAAPVAAATSAATPSGTASPAAAASGANAAGKAIYESACLACHSAGVAGAPKMGDKAAWAPRIQQGMPQLYESVLKGKGAMPPKGGKADATEADIKAVVDYMVAASS